ncbi:MAG: hypothetical protein JST87_05180 [Bacteroidetes bacterium]|nr:hypothetical protein [Bacteroidota bacterium]
MGQKEKETLRYIKKKYGCQTATELYAVVEKLSDAARIESRKYVGGKTSSFSAEIAPEAEILLNKE